MEQLKKISDSLEKLSYLLDQGFTAPKEANWDDIQDKLSNVWKDFKELEKIQNYTKASSTPIKDEPRKINSNGEAVNHPLHYQGLEVNGTSVECIDAMKFLKGWYKTAIFSELNAFKYNWRSGEKDAIPQELGKIGWYGNKAQELWKENLNWFYPKNKHYYAIIDIGTIKMKNPTTGEWKTAILYSDGKGLYVRDLEDFNNKFKFDK